ncbi:MAG: family 1 encapsulin nanocompartment shell protein [Spirochaetaceae bacterium]
MNILRRALAPVSNEGWQEIDTFAADYLRNSLTGRRLVDVEGPRGWGYHAASNGRLGEIKKTGKVSYGLYDVRPLLELRVPFELDIWELDNAARGAEDVDLDALEKAAEEAASFEDGVIFEGLGEAGVTGLSKAGERPSIQFPQDPEQMIQAVSQGIGELMKDGIEGPYSLAVPLEIWKQLSSYIKGRSLKTHLEQLLGGSVLPTRHLEAPLLVSIRGGDFLMTIGQDLSIGYGTHSSTTVELYFTESFTFQVLESRAVVGYK